MPHHFVFYPVAFALLNVAIVQLFTREGDKLLWIFIAVIIALIIWVAFMLRQHYALTLQNRMIILEMRYRYFTITGERLELLENRLTEGQIFALRFAPDNELAGLTQKAIDEKLSPDAIKKSINTWRADHRRV